MFLRGRPVTMHIPDQQRGSYSLDHKVALPNHKLKLQWVYPPHQPKRFGFSAALSCTFLKFSLLLSSPLNRRCQVRLPWTGLQVQPLPPAHRRDRVLQRLRGGALQHRGAAAEALPGTQR